MAAPPPGFVRDLPFAGRDELAAVREACGDEAAVRGDFAEAISCWEESLAILQARALDASEARVATKLAAAEEASGLITEACARYAQAAEAYLRSGEVHLAPMCLNNLAMLRQTAGAPEEAAGILRRALAQCRSCRGDFHTETALISSNLGAVLADLRDLVGAVEAHMEALRIRESLYGPAHPEVGLSLGHLAASHQLAGDEDKARRHYESALAVLAEFPDLHNAEREVLRANLEELNSPAEVE
jgi:tetratricopeptide (TPR) repeat protein